MLKPGSFVVFRLKKRNGHCVCLCGKFDGLLVVSLRLSICFEYFFSFWEHCFLLVILVL